MKTGIIGILNNPATSLNSHSAGMVNIVAKLFDAQILTENDDWDEYEKLIIYHGTNFKPGSFNVIGGINQEIIIKANRLYAFLQNRYDSVYTLDGFQLNEFSVKRKLLLYDNAIKIQDISLPEKNNLVIGDSHSISVWQDDSYTINRNDGKTLHGFLKMQMDLSKYNKIIFYFGNIDLRFHLARQQNPQEATKDLFQRYCDYACKYNSTLTSLLPIEPENRKIPKSGQYKGKNFFGDLELRKELRFIANKTMLDSKIPLLEWPSSFLDENNNMNFDIMEPKQSVHIRPKYYMKEILKQLKLF